MIKDQNQQVSDGGAAIQAGGNVTIINAGVTYEDVRNIALDVFRANFHELSKQAKEVAQTRAEQVTEEFLSKLQKENPSGLGKVNDPDFQYALFTVQKEFARTGDKDLGDLLIDLLVDRSKQEQRDILQIVLNESLETAPKLTDNQLAALAIVFLFKYTQSFNVKNHEALGQYLDQHVAPFASKLLKNMASYQHLEFCGCGSIGIGSISLEAILGTTYQGQFLKGFDSKEISERGVSIGDDPRFFIPCLNDPKLLQVNSNSKEMLEKMFDSYDVSAEDRTKISVLFDFNKMSDAEIKAKCIEIRPFMSDVFDTWSGSQMAHFTLTSVGIAIGHANVKRLVGEFANLSIWIN
jgi:hypothetical protein